MTYYYPFASDRLSEGGMYLNNLLIHTFTAVTVPIIHRNWSRRTPTVQKAALGRAHEAAVRGDAGPDQWLQRTAPLIFTAFC